VLKVSEISCAEPTVVRAWFDHTTRKIRLELSTGLELAFPAENAQGLQNASDQQLSRIEITPMGLGLHWPECDADLLVSGMLQGYLGSKSFMRDHLARAGRVQSDAKAKAARLNGAKGGRPKKSMVSGFAP
jgi:hypothetical protein